MSNLSIDILISTYNDGICGVSEILLPPREGVGYVVSMQYTEERFLSQIPVKLNKRKDVKLCFLEGVGLSANRNNALRNSNADICILADDDVRYKAEDIDEIRRFFAEHSDVDVAIWQAKILSENRPIKSYPDYIFDYSTERPKGYYPSSIEISFRRKSVSKADKFDVRLGIGSENTLFGEEEVWIETLRRKGKKIVYVPKVVVGTIDVPRSSSANYSNPKYWFTKGAALCKLTEGRIMPHIMKLVLSEFIRHGVNPFFSYRHIINGVVYIQRTERLDINGRDR